jgi:CDP-diacylglycerol---glycerol-3-phosphate 3-phosphatidyltransferase
LFDGRFRTGVDRVVRPVGNALVRTRLSPDHLTTFGLLVSVPTAWAIGTGRLGLGLALLIFSAVPDLLDGALAKAAKRTTVRGAFFDSVCDRVSDTFVLGGFAWYLQNRYGGHAAMLPFAILGVSLLISYLRAKAESLGFQAKGGIMERAERVVVLCAGLAFSFVLVPLLWIMLALTIVTAAQRFRKVWRQATVAEGLGSAKSALRADASDRPAHPAAARAVAVDPVAADPVAAEPVPAEAAEPVPAIPPMAARWRAWRESTGWVPRSEREPRNERYTHGYRRDGAGERWRERRLARKLAVDSEPRRRGSRRP